MAAPLILFSPTDRKEELMAQGGSMALSIIGAVTGIVGLIISLTSHFFQTRHSSVTLFLTELGSVESIAAREHVHNTPPGDIDAKDKSASYIVNFYHKWGIMAERRLLPLWVFNAANIAGMHRLRGELEPYIARAKQAESSYASGFDWLCRKFPKD